MERQCRPSRLAVALLCVASSAWVPLACASLYAPGDGVTMLTGSNFDDLVIKPDGVAVVEFFAPWCGHCKSLAPHYKKVAQSLKGAVFVGAVDCDSDRNGKLCIQYGIKGFPTIKLFGPEKQKNPYTGDVTREATDYNGPMSAKPLAEAVTALLTDLHITRLASKAAHDEFLASPAKQGLAKALLFTDKAESSVAAKGLSHQLHAGLAFGEVHSSAEELVSHYGVEAFPAVLVVKADGSVERYSGDMKASPLREFLAKFWKPPAKEGASKGGKEGAKQQGESPSLSELEASMMLPLAGWQPRIGSLDEVLEADKAEDMHLFGFYRAAGDECSEQVAAVNRTLSDMGSVVKSALVNLATPEDTAKVAHMGVSEAGLAGEPCAVQLVLLPFGTEKPDLEDYATYKGQLEGKALQRWVTDAMPNYATEVTAQSLPMFIHDSPNRDKNKVYPKAILFTKQEDVPGVYKALALNFRDATAVSFGWIRAGGPGAKEAMAGLRVTRVPMLGVILRTPRQQLMGGNADDAGPMSMHPYMGPLKYNPMSQYLDNIRQIAEQHIDGNMPAERMVTLDKLVPEIKNDKGFREQCVNKGGLCIVGLLEPSHGGHGEMLQDLAKIAAGSESDPIHFSWVSARPQRPLLDALRVMRSDVPTMVAISPKKMRYAVLPADVAEASGGKLPITVTSIKKFVEGVLSGKIRTEPLAGLPSIVDVSDADAAPETDDDGAEVVSEQQAPEPPVEDEFDLSDIMAEEVEGSLAGLGKADKLQQIEEELQAEAKAKAKSSKKKKKKSKKKGTSTASKEEL